MTKPFFLDLETFSETDIKDGTDNYARDAEIMLWAYAAGEKPATVYDATTGARMPSELEDNLLDERVILIAHNSAFDRTVLYHNRFKTAQERWRCTMAQALAHGLPGGLDKLCEIFQIGDDKAKLKDGKALVRLFCCPRPKNVKLRRATRLTHPDDWARFMHYAGNDIEAMREVSRKMPKWNYNPGELGANGPVADRELALWHLDQKINQRGVCIDLDLVRGAIDTAEITKDALAQRAQELTDGEIEATTQRDALLSLLNEFYDLNLPDLKASTVERLLKSDADLPPTVVELLENRLAASSTSVSKYKRFLQLTGPDSRLRNTLQFCGASRTGRWAGRGVQLQNLPRPVLKQKVIDQGIAAIKAGVADIVFPNPMELLSSAVRGSVVATPGKKLVVADLSNIEGRMLAFLAGEQWKLQAFRDFDAGLGADLYAVAYAKAFNVTPEVVMENKKSGDGMMRQIGKVMELMLGYAGGVGAFVTGALTYRIDLESMAAGAIGLIPKRILAEATRSWEWAVEKKRTYGLSVRVYLVCDSFKRLWREAHVATEDFWYDLEFAFRKAISNPGEVYNTADPDFQMLSRMAQEWKRSEKAHTRPPVRVTKSGAWVRIILPSGRSLCYPSARMDDKGNLSYRGVNQFSRQWCRLKTYSGKLAENITQAASRDIIAWNLPAVEQAGYEVASSVHDEDITEAPDSPDYDEDKLAGIMATNPPWSVGLPLAAAGFTAYRYRKD